MRTSKIIAVAALATDLAGHAYESPYVALGYARLLYADPLGSIVYRSSSAGTSTHINTYDEYGQPAATSVGRFQYTGQVWIDELGMESGRSRGVDAGQLHPVVEGPAGAHRGAPVHPIRLARTARTAGDSPKKRATSLRPNLEALRSMGLARRTGQGKYAA